MLPRATFGWGAAYLPIKALPNEMPMTAGPIGAITLEGRPLSAAAKLFLNCLRELVAKKKIGGTKMTSAIGKGNQASSDPG